MRCASATTCSAPRRQWPLSNPRTTMPPRAGRTRRHERRADYSKRRCPRAHAGHRPTEAPAPHRHRRRRLRWARRRARAATRRRGRHTRGPHHHHLFKPLLYQVAGGGLAAGERATRIRTALRRNSNITVLMVEASGLDAERRQLVLDRGERLAYYSLVVACGAGDLRFRQRPVAEASCGLKTLADALDLRNRIYGAFEEAERAARRHRAARVDDVVVIGGGPYRRRAPGGVEDVGLDGMKRGF